MDERLRNNTGLGVNRDAIVVRPAQPFLDWLCRVDPTCIGYNLDILQAEPAIYLLPCSEHEGGAEELLHHCFDVIFVEQLDGWYQFQDAWPQERTFEMFREWFEWSYHSRLLDLDTGSLRHDEH